MIKKLTLCRFRIFCWLYLAKDGKSQNCQAWYLLNVKFQMQRGLISSQYFLLLLSNSNTALLLTHSWEMQHNGWIVMQLGRLEFQHIPYCAPCPCRSRWILEHCGIATYCIALWNCNILCCIVEHSARRILQHCQQVKWDSSTLQQIALHWGWTLISRHSTPAGMATGPMVLDQEADKEVNVVSDIKKLFNLSTLMF